MTKRLENKVAIVTGASRGIGASIAKKLAGEGAHVIVNYVQRKQPADEVVRSITSNAGKAAAVQADVATSEGARLIFEAAEKEFGPVEIMVNNAGLILYKPLAEVSEEEFDNLFSTNVKGTFLTCKLAASRMRE